MSFAQLDDFDGINALVTTIGFRVMEMAHPTGFEPVTSASGGQSRVRW